MSQERKAKVAVIYYSMYGHIATMAKAVAKGVEAAGGECKLLQVAETLPPDVLEKMHAPSKDTISPNVPIATNDDLIEADAIIFGSPTRFGMISAQLKSFLDSTGTSVSAQHNFNMW